ncbi:hypothetical protein U1Q18_035239 [Sarracenia purpurea var. burkii]
MNHILRLETELAMETGKMLGISYAEVEHEAIEKLSKMNGGVSLEFRCQFLCSEHWSLGWFPLCLGVLLKKHIGAVDIVLDVGAAAIVLHSSLGWLEPFSLFRSVDKGA